MILKNSFRKKKKLKQKQQEITFGIQRISELTFLKLH